VTAWSDDLWILQDPKPAHVKVKIATIRPNEILSTFCID
jgi:hypothetical protein